MPKITRDAVSTNEKLTFPVKQSSKSRIAGKLRYWWCWIAAGSLLLFVGAPALAVLWLADRRESLYPLARWGARTWLKACGARVRVVGRENLAPGASYVFASNHRSYLDTAALFAYAGPKIGIVAKKELLKVPVMGQGMGFVNIIAIDRTNSDRAVASMEKARAVVKRGYSFGVFVEGTRALPGQLMPFKKGAFHLALQTGASIVPVAMKNTDWMIGKRTGVAYPGEIKMILLPEITTAGRDSGDIPTLLMQAREAIARELDILE
jgi:1-acyl-sn-glycerol-3-phosphate acyltransferase